MGLFEEYCGSSTVHGVRYFTDKKRHWMERVWWIFAFALALFYCNTFINRVYFKWVQNQIFISSGEKSTPVWKIPFPAVTVCPETKANMSQLNFDEVFHKMASAAKPTYNITAEEDELMAALLQICDSRLTYDFEIGENFTDSSITVLLRDTAPSLTDTLPICKFKNVVDHCQKYFEETMTEEGLCFTFNALNGTELYSEDLSPDNTRIDHNMSAEFWNLEDGYDPSIEMNHQTYPYRVFGPGARNGLFVLLNLFKPNLEYRCRDAVQGFKIVLHTPEEVPQMSKHYFRVPLLQEVSVSVKPNMITTSEGLRYYEPNRRQCYFATERKLRFFKMYSQRNCELECLSNYTLQACGCVKFSMPRDKDTPICGAAKIACYNAAENSLFKKQVSEEMTLKPGAEKIQSCNCLPACTSITYDAEISQAPLNWDAMHNAYNRHFDDLDGMQPVQLSIFFKEKHFVVHKRDDSFDVADLFANCGGLIGLFMGASFLSIVELLYFFSLRLCCNLRSHIHKKRMKQIADSGIPEIVVVKPNDDDKKE